MPPRCLRRAGERLARGENGLPGYTTLSYLIPYQQNTVSLHPTRLPADAEITQTDVKVIPTKGAVTWAAFATHVSGRALISLKYPDGQVLSFGALATLSSKDGGTSGVVGDGGQVYLTELPHTGQLMVQWGEGSSAVRTTSFPE